MKRKYIRYNLSDIYDDNGNPFRLMPWQVSKSSSCNKYKCDLLCMRYHEYRALPANITLGSWCSSHQRPKNQEKTFRTENPDTAETWDYYANFLSPDDFSPCSMVKSFFICRNCSHRYENQLEKIEIRKTSGCPYCSGRFVCGIKSCKYCRDKSFATNHRAKDWIKGRMNGYLRPWEVYEQSDCSFWFRCKKYHRFEATPHMIHGEGTWCSRCRFISFADDRLSEFLSSFIGKDSFERDFSFDWAISESGYPLRYDFYISALNLILEVDGEQHFRYTGRGDYEDTRKKDILKMKLAFENDISIIRISGKSISSKTFKFSRITPFLRRHKRPVCIFISLEKKFVYEGMIKDYIKKYVLGIEQ
jgi:Probable Zinc-ribbon domain